jgi:hypothetical protein
MKDFHQWLAERGIEINEKGKRTALSANYPSLYHSIRQQPRQTWTPISATAALADKQIGPDEKVTDGGPNETDKKDNPHKSFYNTSEWSKFRDNKIGLNEHPALAAVAGVARAALPHVARGAGAAVANKMMQPKQQDQANCRKMMQKDAMTPADHQSEKLHTHTRNHNGKTYTGRSGTDGRQQKRDVEAQIHWDRSNRRSTSLGTPIANDRKMMHKGDKPWMKTKGHPGKHNV